MKNVDLGRSIGGRFHRPAVPTLLTQSPSTRIPIVVAHVRSDDAMPAPTLLPPVEAAFAIHVHHRSLSRVDTWIDGKHASLPSLPSGGICVFDLETAPVAWVHEAFDFTRFHVTASTLKELSYEQNIPFHGSLRAPSLGHSDPVLEHLALALAHREAVFGTETDSLFTDWVVLAFHAHIVATYGEATRKKPWAGGLSQRRLDNITEWISERLGTPLSIALIAAEAGMTPGHFARSFKQATGETPHKWVMRARVRRAKDLLSSTDLPISEIALICGFVDQSHLTRAFTRVAQISPGSWRRQIRH